MSRAVAKGSGWKRTMPGGGQIADEELFQLSLHLGIPINFLRWEWDGSKDQRT